ncbi:MAG: FAD-dependent oxidoreductase [Ignavibacteriae bacterium]|nr:FAD-dependent oxidoreductase [Ignavibacteriota bacterium]
MKKKIVVLGTGFSAFSFMKKINRNKYDITVVSPRNHFLFTPLLPSTTVGTIEFRSIIEPIRNLDNIVYHQAYCLNADTENKTVTCKDGDTGKIFSLCYDYLVIAVGEVTNTYNIEGVKDYALFLKELSDARKIRTKVIDCFENASLPELTEEEKRSYLRFVVCGGGPTGVEFAAELHDFLEDDVRKKYRDLVKFTEVVLIEAGETVLATFDKKLSEYTMKVFRRQKISLKINSFISRVTERKIYLKDGSNMNYGVLVWATGNKPTDFIRNSGFVTDKKGRLTVDMFFRLKKDENSIYENIFAAGDCTRLETGELPATAQVAQQQGIFLAKYFNREMNVKDSFKFKNLGMLAYIGGHKALADTPQFKGTGFKTFVFWRSAYLTRLVSFKNKLLVIFDWTKTFLFGRDVSNF